MSDFTGFPEAALDFYDDLEMDNTKSFWEAHKAIYTDSVKAPMVALTDALEKEFGKPRCYGRSATSGSPRRSHQFSPTG